MGASDGVAMMAEQLRRVDVRDEAEFLMAQKGYSPSDAWKAANERVLPISNYELIAAMGKTKP
jgi:hypothetical protein